MIMHYAVLILHLTMQNLEKGVNIMSSSQILENILVEKDQLTKELQKL